MQMCLIFLAFLAWRKHRSYIDHVDHCQRFSEGLDGNHSVAARLFCRFEGRCFRALAAIGLVAIVVSEAPQQLSQQRALVLSTGQSNLPRRMLKWLKYVKIVVCSKAHLAHFHKDGTVDRLPQSPACRWPRLNSNAKKEPQ